MKPTLFMPSLGAVAMALGGCIEPEVAGPIAREGAADTGMIDATMDLGPPADGVTRIETPTFVVEPYDEIIVCYVGSFPDDAERLAISWASMHEHPIFGHHIQFNGLRGGSDGIDAEDGELLDCSDPLTSMLASTNILNLNRPFADGSGGEMVLPDDVAVAIPGGSKWLFEYHVVNTTPRRVRARGVMDLLEVDPEAVQEWAAPWVFNDSGFALPPGEATEVLVDCEWPSEARVLSVLGHMHDFGLSLSVDMVTPGGEQSTIYDAAEWDLAWRYMPYVVDFDGGLPVSEGTRFLTTCSFFNSGADEVLFPEEMCVASGMFMPAEAPLACDAARDGE
jgi:hypothetical protein